MTCNDDIVVVVSFKDYKLILYKIRRNLVESGEQQVERRGPG